MRTMGQRIVIAVILAIVGLSLLTIVSFTSFRGTERLPQQIVRFLLTIALCYFLYRGANWARWVTVVLCGLGGPAAVLSGVALLPLGFPGVLLIAMGLTYIVCAGILLFAPSVRVYFTK